MGRSVLFFISLILISGCNGLPSSSTTFAAQPRVLHVFNGSTLGYYNDNGSYAFTTKAASIFSLGQNIGTSQQFPQDTSNGFSFLGTVSCTTGCNEVIGFKGYSGGFRSGLMSNSVSPLNAGGSTTGLAVDSTYGNLYVADSVNSYVYFLSASTGFILKGPIYPPTGAGADYLGFDSYLRRLFVAENSIGTIWAYDPVGNAMLTTSPAQLTITGGGCNSNAISYVAVNQLTHLGYVLCGSTIVIFKTSGLPSYLNSAPSDSTFTLTNITQANDLVFDNTSNTIVAVGQSFVTALNGSDGSAAAAVDVSTGNCGYATYDLEGVAYSSAKATIYVADATNSVIYLLDAGTLNFKNGTCLNSSYSTATDVPNPKRLSYF